MWRHSVVDRTALEPAQDYWHHWEDVTAGFLLGAALAYVFYRQHYPFLCSRTAAGEPLVTMLPRNAGSKYSILQEDRPTQPSHIASELSPLGASARQSDGGVQATYTRPNDLPV